MTKIIARCEYKESRTRHSIEIAALMLTALLGACSGPDADGTLTMTIVVRADSDAPENYDVEPGGVMPAAEVSVYNSESSDDWSITSTTDDNGRVAFSVVPGAYVIVVDRKTHDPYCRWYGYEDIEIGARNKKVKLDPLRVQCK